MTVSLPLKNGETKTPGRVIPGASRPRSRTSQGQEPYTGVIDLTLRGDVGNVGNVSLGRFSRMTSISRALHSSASRSHSPTMKARSGSDVGRAWESRS